MTAEPCDIVGTRLGSNAKCRHAPAQRKNHSYTLAHSTPPPAACVLTGLGGGGGYFLRVEIRSAVIFVGIIAKRRRHRPAPLPSTPSATRSMAFLVAGQLSSETEAVWKGGSNDSPPPPPGNRLPTIQSFALRQCCETWSATVPQWMSFPKEARRMSALRPRIGVSLETQHPPQCAQAAQVRYLGKHNAKRSKL